MLNFDLLALIFIFFAIIYGIYRGIYKQIRATASLVVPIVVIFLTKQAILSFLNGITLFTKIATFIQKIFRFVLEISIDDVKTLLVIILVFFIIMAITKTLFSVFAPSKKSNVMKFKNSTSRFIGGAIGIVNAYAIIIMALILLKPIVPVNYNTPLTKLLININEPLQEELGDAYTSQLTVEELN